MRRVRALILGVIVLAACTGAHAVAERPVVTTATAREPVPRVCHASLGRSGVRHLRSSSGSVWVWIESGARPQFRVGSTVKVVWRITGTGAPHTVLLDPYGRNAKLVFGPQPHATSTFDHPGAEYGTGFVPKSPGCWQFGMRRGTVEGRVSLLVVP